MFKSPLDPRIRTVLPLVQGLAEMFGPECEVVLHDINALPRSIVAIENGHVTGRTVGDVPTDLMLRTLRNVDEAQDVRVYVSSSDGKILKSLAITLRDAQGKVTPVAVESAPAHNYVLGIDFQGDDIWVATAKGLSHGIRQQK